MQRLIIRLGLLNLNVDFYHNVEYEHENRCLQNLRVPRTCPLCRGAFHLLRAVRVHVEIADEQPTPRSPSSATAPTPPPPPPELDPEEVEAKALTEQLAHAWDVDSAGVQSESAEALADVGAWLDGVDADAVSVLNSCLASHHGAGER